MKKKLEKIICPMCDEIDDPGECAKRKEQGWCEVGKLIKLVKEMHDDN